MKRISNKGNKGLKRGKEVGRGRHNFLEKCPTAHEEDAKLGAVSSIAVFTHCVESRREGNAHGFSTSWVSGVVVVCLHTAFIFYFRYFLPTSWFYCSRKMDLRETTNPNPRYF